MPRGSLINIFVAVIWRLDTAATAAVPGGGYDAEFGETIPVDNGTQEGESSLRYEATPLRVEVQLDRDPKWHEAILTRAGIKQAANIVLVMHREFLENAGLVDANGKVMLNKGDKLEQIETTAGAIQDKFDDPPGMIIIHHEPAGYGLEVIDAAQYNLEYVYCAYKQTSEESP